MLGMVYDKKAYAVAGRVELIQHVYLQRFIISDAVSHASILAVIGTTLQVAVSDVLPYTIWPGDA